MRYETAESFEEWRSIARLLLAHDIHPDTVVWNAGDGQQGLFPQALLPEKTAQFSIPREFISLAKDAACHRNPARWTLLYYALWRLTHGEKHLLHLTTDPLMRELEMMRKAVRRDAHKAKAFVRFRKVETEEGDHYIAWHEPDHRILRKVAPFFSRRFSDMRWTILSPDETVSWDGESLSYGPGVPASEAPQEDTLEILWQDFYRAIFNPARIKTKAMKKEMPVRYWKNLPEARLISSMLDEAPQRVEAMVKHTEGMARSAEDFIPERFDLEILAEASKACQGCPLYLPATQTVFGEGPEDAKIMLIGEQPGDKEDLAGKPFIGPAGKVLDKALEEVGLSRDKLYLTNAVKHFKFAQDDRGFRHHRTPGLREMTACNPWLEAEIQTIKPEIIVGLGATAGKALLGAGFKITQSRGQWIERKGIASIMTYHPSAVLRAIDEDQRQLLYGALVNDLSLVAERLAELAA
jgi:uracil-DNA glycosylase